MGMVALSMALTLASTKTGTLACGFISLSDSGFTMLITHKYTHRAAIEYQHLDEARHGNPATVT